MPDGPSFLRVLILGRHWQKFETFEVQFKRAASEIAVEQGESRLATVTVSRRQFERWCAGRVKTEPHPDACRVLEHMFNHPIRQLLAPADRVTQEESDRLEKVNITHPNQPAADEVELLRQDLNDTLSEGTMAEASLDDWERTVIRYGRATRDRPAPLVLSDLSADLTELKRVLQRYRSATALRRLTRVAAHMSGLMCLTFCKLDDRPSFRRWARTARLAAEEAGDPLTLSWVLAQEAYGHYYSADLLEAIDLARHAQDVTHAIPCVGAALAAALEARAHAAMGHHQETRQALARAEDILSHLDGEDLIPSAFSYNEAQLRFHEGNAYTHLQDTKPAIKAQERALELGTPDDYTDWAMTRLGQATCLMYAGDMPNGITYAIATLTSLTPAQRQGIIALRGQEVLRTLPTAERTRPEARELRELLTLVVEEKEIECP